MNLPKLWNCLLSLGVKTTTKLASEVLNPWLNLATVLAMGLGGRYPHQPPNCQIQHIC